MGVKGGKEKGTISDPEDPAKQRSGKRSTLSRLFLTKCRGEGQEFVWNAKKGPASAAKKKEGSSKRILPIRLAFLKELPSKIEEGFRKGKEHRLPNKGAM